VRFRGLTTGFSRLGALGALGARGARVRTRAAFLAALAAAVVHGGGCSLTADLDGLSSGGALGDDDGAGSGEGGGDGAATADGGDGSVPIDGGDAARPFLCADLTTPPVFCADFEITPISQGWDDTRNAGGGTVGPNAGRVDGGYSMLGRVPQREGGVSAAALVRSLELPPRGNFTIALDMYVFETFAGGGAIDLVGFEFNNSYYSLSLRAENDGSVRLREYADAVGSTPTLVKNTPLTRALPTSGWVSIRMSVSFGSSAAKLVLTFDGQTALDTEIEAYSYAKSPIVVAGIPKTEGAGKSVAIRIDDVVVTSP